VKALLSDVRATPAFEDVTTSWKSVRAYVHVVVPLAALLVVVVLMLWVRIEANRHTADIKRYDLRAREAATAEARLELDVDIRHGAGWLEAAAATYGLVPATETRLVRLEEAAR
jgi:hypothetical protein